MFGCAHVGHPQDMNTNTNTHRIMRYSPNLSFDSNPASISTRLDAPWIPIFISFPLL